MIKSRMYITVSMIIILGFSLSALAQPTAERSFHENTYTPEVPVYVYLKISVETGVVGSIVVAEKPPTGWTIIKGSPYNPSVKEGVITWNVTSTTASTLRLMYEVMPPSSSAGAAMFSGKAGDQEVGGTTTLSRVEPKPIGIFQNHIDSPDMDLKWPNPSGDAIYNSLMGEYKITGGGTGGSESPHSVYTIMNGNFSFQAKIRIEYVGTTGFGVLAVHEGMDHAYVLSDFYGVCIGTNGCFPLWRKANSYQTGNFVNPKNHDGQVMITRESNTYSMYYFNIINQQWTKYHSQNLELMDPVCVVLAKHSADSGISATAYFTEVELKPLTSAVEEWELYD